MACFGVDEMDSALKDLPSPEKEELEEDKEEGLGIFRGCAMEIISVKLL